MFPVLLRRFFVVILIVMSLAFSAYQTLNLFHMFHPQVAEKNEVSVWENRLGPLKDKLPPNVTEIGYLAEWDIPDVKYGHTDQFHEFNLTVYSLAPVIVRRGAETEWIMGNFGTLSPQKIETWLDSSIGPHITQEFSGGIYLIHRVEK